MGASLLAAAIVMAAVSYEPTSRHAPSTGAKGNVAQAGEVDRSAHAALGIDAMEVVEDEEFGRSIRGANQGLDGLIGLALMNRGAGSPLSNPSGSGVSANSVMINAGQTPTAETQRAAQYMFVIRWLMISSGSDLLSRRD